MNPKKLFMSVCMLLIISASSAYAGFAPMNPAFIEWREEQLKQAENQNSSDSISASSVSGTSSISATSHKTGYIPGPVNLSHLADNLPRVFAAAELPESYDLRVYDRVTPIKNQGVWGTCWAFGMTAAVESNYLTHLANNDGKVDGSWGNVESLDMSELHMSWFAKNHPDKTRRTGPERGQTALTIIDGGLTGYGIAYLSRLDGPATSSMLPYLSIEALSNDAGFPLELWRKLEALPTPDDLNRISLMRSGKKLVPDSLSYPADFFDEKLPALRLTDALFSTPWPITAGIRDEYMENISSNDLLQPNMTYTKSLIMQHGALAIAYFAGEDEDALNTKTGAYFDKNAKVGKANHQVAIVGWDDNYPRTNFIESARPSSNGAWLVKNSWGKRWPIASADLSRQAGLHDGGYFWMSYEQPFLDGIEFIVEDKNPNLNIYEYDPLGWCSSYGEANTTMWGANAFKVLSRGESLESIAFYTTENNAVVNWYVYYGIKDRPTERPYPESGTSFVSGTETFPYAGYHTVKLPSPVALTAGEYFTVVIEFKNEGYVYPVAVEHKIEGYSDFAVVHDYESWISTNGTEWRDAVELEVYDLKSNVMMHTPMNVCIKAFTLNSTNNNAVYSDDVKTVIEIPVEEEPKMLIGNIKDSNKGLRNFPVQTVDINIAASYDESVKVPEGSRVIFWLQNTTEDNEYVLSYTKTPFTEYPKGRNELSEFEYDPLFDPEFEPDIFWKDTFSRAEYPVYGPFYETLSGDLTVTVEANNLSYVNGTKGKIPLGYYTFVYNIEGYEKGYLQNVILVGTDSEDADPDPDPEPDPDPDPAPTPIIVNRAGSSGGGCNAFTGIFALSVLALIPSVRRKRH